MIVRRVRGLLGTMARTAVVAGTATAVSGGVRRRQDARAEQEAQSQAYQQQAAAQQTAAQQTAAPQYAQAPPPPTAADLTTRLKELADLNAAGAITDEEFTAAKAKLLDL